MNAKTYGQILTEETAKRINDRMTTDGYEKSQEEISRAVILEFVMRVEERAQSFSDDSDIPIWAVNTYEKAFLQLSTELKEAK